MVINTKKTKVLCFNLTKKFQFLPQLNLPGLPPLEVVHTTKLLGVTLSSDLSWATHVTDIVKKASNKLWALLRFRELNATLEQMKKVYETRVRTVLEYPSPLFSSGLTKEQSDKIENIQVPPYLKEENS